MKLYIKNALILARENKSESRECFSPREATSVGSYQVPDVRPRSVLFASTFSQ